MISLKKRTSGFTVVELLIVLLVIGFLTAVIITTHSGIEAKQRNTDRETDIDTLQSQLETFYSQNQYYPSLKDMNSASWRKANMPNLSSSAMEDPSAPSSVYASGPVLAATPKNSVHEYAYSVSDSGDSCENDDTTCNTYTLTAELEGGGTYTKSNLD